METISSPRYTNLSFSVKERIMATVYYREFEDLSDLNEYIRKTIKREDVISLSYVDGNHCLYFWM